MNAFASPSVRRLATASAGLLIAGIVVAIVALTASATTTGHTIAVSHATRVAGRSEPIAVDARGRPLYVLSPETVSHRLCTSMNGCFRFWPPLTVAAHRRPTKAAGVAGTLSTTTRDGVRQATLDGHPLYTYTGDHGTASATGQGVRTFGGTWHVLREGPARGATAPASSGSTTGVAGGGW